MAQSKGDICEGCSKYRSTEGNQHSPVVGEGKGGWSLWLCAGRAWLTGLVSVSCQVKIPSSLSFPCSHGNYSGSVLTMRLCGDTEAHAEMGVLSF